MDHPGSGPRRPAPPAHEIKSELHPETIPSVEEDRAVQRSRSARLQDHSATLIEQAHAATQRASALEQEVQQLVTAIGACSSIDRVVGILMALLSCDAETAFESLKYVSSNTNRKIRDLAELIEAQVSLGHGLPDDVARALADVLGRPGSG